MTLKEATTAMLPDRAVTLLDITANSAYSSNIDLRPSHTAFVRMLGRAKLKEDKQVVTPKGQ